MGKNTYSVIVFVGKNKFIIDYNKDGVNSEKVFNSKIKMNLFIKYLKFKGYKNVW